MMEFLKICISICFLKFCTAENSPWSFFQSSIPDESREELVVNKITSEEILTFDLNITKWKSLTIGPTCYSVGITKTGLQILMSVLNENNTEFRIEKTFYETKYTPLDSIIFHNRNNGKSEVIIVVSATSPKEISWLRISPDHSVEEFWKWPVEHELANINFYKRYIFYTDTTKTGYLYEFNLKNNPPNRWFIQQIPFESTPTSSAFNRLGDQDFLSVPQKNSIVIYKHTGVKFRNYTTITTPGVTRVTNFDIGFKTFLAVNGINPGLYEFTENGLIYQNIAHSNLEGVELWLPIHLETIRDEVFLFVQRVLDHSTHESVEVDIITYHNGVFEEHEDIPCEFFGETTENLGCFNTKKGIIGSTSIVVDNKVGLLVPTTNNSFVLFAIHTFIKQKPHPREQDLLDLLEKKKTLQVLLDKTNDLYEEISALPVDSNVPKTAEIVMEPHNSTVYLERLEKLGEEIDKLHDKVEILNQETNRKFDTIIINGEAIFEGDVNVTDLKITTINGELCTELLNDIVHKENITKELKNKTFLEVEIENVQTQSVNGIDIVNIAFKDDPEIVLNGSITFKDAVVLKNLTTEMVNDVNIEYLGDLKQTRSRRSVDNANDTVVIPQNLTVQFINGENFTEFLQSLCMVNKICYIPGTVNIKEKIEAETVNTDYLNEIKYPEEYLLHNNDTSKRILGKKTFKNALQTEEIRTISTLNGINTKNLVTLTTDQKLDKLIFNKLQVTEELKVEGNILGDSIAKFLPKPTLEETNIIMCNVQFKNINVKGNIIVEHKFNNKDFKASLDNIIYDDEDQATISSIKDFPRGLTVHGPLHIKSNSINSHNLGEFVTKNTDQNLDVSLINGNVIIRNLIVNGSYNGQDIKTLDDSLVKLTGNQFVYSVLSFDDLEAENVVIDRTLNDISPDDFLYVNKTFDVDSLSFDEFIAENLTVKGSLQGNISGFDIKDINNRYLSRTKSQTIEPRFVINSTKIDQFKSINADTVKIIEEESYLKYVRDLLSSGNLTVENLHVEESLQINNINNKPAVNIMPDTVLGIARKNGNKLILEDLFLKDLHLTQLGAVNWNDYVQQIVYKNQTNSFLKFDKPKQFLNGITVKNLIETKKINNVSIFNVLTKQGDQTIRGPVEIVGNVVVENIEINDTINQVSVNDFNVGITEGAYHLKRDVVFKRLPHIKSLRIDGTVNNKNINDVLRELVYKNHTGIFTNDIIFTKPINIGGNLVITDYMNDVNFSDVNSNIVLLTQDAEIEGLVSFTKNVEISNNMEVDNLQCKHLSGYNTNDWYQKAIFINKGLLKGHYTMESMEINADLTTEFVNNFNMSRIVPLKTNQTIEHLHIAQMKFLQDIPVGNKVNGMVLPTEYQRTFMKTGDQLIESNTTFDSVLIRRDLNASLLNNKPTSRLVTTNTDQNLTAKYEFKSKITIDSDLSVNGSINNVNYTEWKRTTMKLNSNRTVQVSNNWTVTKNITFDDNVVGQGTISGLDLSLIGQQLREREDWKYQFEHGTIKDHNSLCATITSFYEKTKQQIYKFKYFEDLQQLPFNHTINNVFNFELNEIPYLLVNYDTCLSDMLVYSGSRFVLYSSNIPTGTLEQVVPVTNKKKMYLVTRRSESSLCGGTNGTNIWEFDGDTLKLNYVLGHQNLLHDSLVPGTFYALNKEGVVEYKIRSSREPLAYRKWAIPFEDETEFVPRGLKTGLAMRTGSNILFLHRFKPVANIDTDTNIETTVTGSYREVTNNYIPGKHGDVAVLKVGKNSAKKILLAVAQQEETVVKASFDVIKIYEDAFEGKLFDKISAYKPSSLLSIEFGQGETLLAFLENRKKLRFYEYKGIEGFLPRNAIKLANAQSLFQMDLIGNAGEDAVKTVGIVYNNKIRIIQAVMEGTTIQRDWNCNL
ncbi:unnamed protein product [Phyllotreta striolata]|uniref:Uncharacterized protein n=1 Tax=Phyllotreta striolata TaxID=444603 RepID=A0A9N9XLB3_PHYSR|nr:unnamed protein product [Phyllotreta striolata]